MTADAEVEIVGEERVELQAEQTSFGHQGTMLLDDGKEMTGSIATGKDHGFTTQRTHLGAADVEDVAELSQRRQVYVGSSAAEAIAQSGTVDEERYLVVAAYVVDGAELGLRVDGAVLRGERDVDHARVDHVGPRGVTMEVF